MTVRESLQGSHVMGRKDQRTVVIVLAVVAVSLVLAAVAGVGVVAFVVTNAKQPAAKTYDRDELRTLIDGKTPDEVLKLLGKPATTEDAHGSPGEVRWTYYDLTLDRVSGKRDGFTVIQFGGGRVVGVRSF